MVLRYNISSSSLVTNLLVDRQSNTNTFGIENQSSERRGIKYQSVASERVGHHTWFVRRESLDRTQWLDRYRCMYATDAHGASRSHQAQRTAVYVWYRYMIAPIVWCHSYTRDIVVLRWPMRVRDRVRWATDTTWAATPNSLRYDTSRNIWMARKIGLTNAGLASDTSNRCGRKATNGVDVVAS